MPTLSRSKNICGLANEKEKSNASHLIFSVQNHRLRENKDPNMKHLECRLLHYFSSANFFFKKERLLFILNPILITLTSGAETASRPGAEENFKTQRKTG